MVCWEDITEELKHVPDSAEHLYRTLRGTVSSLVKSFIGHGNQLLDRCAGNRENLNWKQARSILLHNNLHLIIQATSLLFSVALSKYRSTSI